MADDLLYCWQMIDGMTPAAREKYGLEAAHKALDDVANHLELGSNGPRM